ncbi:sugar ABC transporter substrate-binding protein [Bradyrhizobium guangdongense]|nr:polysaccharide biosynthesis/export family protein [Bradyrhizobium guangdongense]TPQ30235.1 sugar ABC transporter substrate-binding protein [Bradyrhizobium guangdongense]
MRGALSSLVLMAVVTLMAGCSTSYIPTSGPLSPDIRAGQKDPESLPYALVKLSPETVRIIAESEPKSIASAFQDRRPPPEIKFGIGDVVAVTIFEAAAGGLFIPIEAGVRPGNFVTLPNQPVDTAGNISVPYAGAVRAKDRTPSQVQQEIVDRIKNRAIEPQAVVAMATQNTSLISVLGEVNNPNRMLAMPAGEHILDAITRAGGPKGQGFETWVMLERKGKRATAPFGALVYEPENNIWVWPGDTVYVYREPQTFLAFGAAGQQGQFAFDAWRISLAEGVAKAGGLVDAQADPGSVFLYRGEPCVVAERLGIDCSKFPGPVIPVIYSVSFKDPAGYFLGTKLQMRNKDVLFVANAMSVEVTKFLQHIRVMIATGNDAVVLGSNSLLLRNLINNP